MSCVRTGIFSPEGGQKFLCPQQNIHFAYAHTFSPPRLIFNMALQHKLAHPYIHACYDHFVILIFSVMSNVFVFKRAKAFFCFAATS